MKVYNAFCSLPATKIILNGWGDVSQCCYQLEQLGNILDPKVSILDLWNSEKAKDIRKKTLDGQLHRVCTSWNTCPFLVAAKKRIDFEAHENFSYPTHLEICLPNTHCNIGSEKPSEDNPACIMCCRNYDFKPQPNITHILCEKAKPLMPYLKRLCVLGIAEPFWKDAIFDILNAIDFQKYKDQICVETNTNVTCLSPRTIHRWFETVSKSDVSFSFDAATPETYQKIRRIEGYEKLVENFKYYVKTKTSKHKATVYNNINLINVHEMVAMVEMAAEHGADQMIMIPTHDQCGRVDMGELLLNSRNVKVFKKYADLAQKRADELKLFLIFAKPFDIVPPKKDDIIQINYEYKLY